MDNFYTISHNRDDVAEYLKNYFNYNLSQETELTAEEIFNTIKSHMSQTAFGELLSEYLLKKYAAELKPYSENYRQDALSKFLTMRFGEMGITGQKNIFVQNSTVLTNELLKKQAKNWLRNVVPSRESVFLMAFALEMNCEELSEFLMFGIRDKGLNYKNPAEVIAFFCLKAGLSYSCAVRILHEAEERAEASLKPVNVFTSEYKSIFEQINTEAELVELSSRLISESHDSKYSTSIKKCYDELLKKVSENAVLDKIVVVSNETEVEIKNVSKISFGTIERYIYYYIPVKNEYGNYRTDTYAPYSNGNISGKQNNILSGNKWFFSTLLRRSDLKKMYDGVKIISRDTILTLAFFAVCEDNSDFNAYEYLADINDYLNFCRFEQINFSYPYDLFIFMCLQTDDPLSSFRKIWRMSWLK